MPITKATATKLALMSKGSYGLGGDVLDAYIWDRALIPATLGDMLLFRTPIGGQYGNGQKTLVETNLQQPGQFPASQNFLMEKIKPDFINGEAYDATLQTVLVKALTLVMRNSVWTISVPNREYEWRMTGNVFLPAIFEQGPATSANQARVGDVNSHSWVNLLTPIPIGELITVTLTITIGSNTSDSTVMGRVLAALAVLHNNSCALGVEVRGTLARSK